MAEPVPDARLRAICLALPEAAEVETWGDATFRVRGRIFAMIKRGDGRVSFWCKAPPGSQAILVEADFSFNPDAVPQMIREIEAGADLVIGARARPAREEEGMPRGRRFGDWLASSLLRATMPVPGVTDYTSTLRAYRVGTLKRAVTAHQEGLITSRDTAANVEILLRLARFHPTIVEVEAATRCDIRPRASRHRLKRALRSELSLTGRVDRAAAPPR